MVSIVVPVYNVKRYLCECVQSVLQLKTDIEVILVDDGSTDGSSELCDTLAQQHDRVRTVHQPNGGLSAARNTGIREAKGEYLLFLDSDDFVDPVITDKMLSALSSAPKVLVGLYQNYYEDTNTFTPENAGDLLKIKGDLGIDQFLSAVPKDGACCYMIACRFIVQRQWMLQNDLFFYEGIYHEDEEWTSRLLCYADRVLVTHHYFYQYRQARAGAITSHVKPKHLFDIFCILHRIKELLDQHLTESIKSDYLRSRMAMLFLNNMIHLHTLKGDEKQTAMKELKAFSKHCTPALCGKIGTVVKYSIYLFGISITANLLGFVRKLLKG